MSTALQVNLALWGMLVCLAMKGTERLQYAPQALR
jgi:hypothetical protein